ncbi:hypothetical protein ASPZODRAFT_360183 [Penicilliopsis zonata CBS 506.65]|uniref:Uncharacterized protein n=1 Tax=Penicilliopsis zonata CBS 506.65 TaxID=1073090 RepID=A0A1L9SVU9_9EURO|nr:hypothetical protein ASPZODRAFT_360183 [Penicilliopsis zonata CBS 506.65]OJJ51318.1 hypothetical protein ASPZODRAFT_360183 [Penicilliopsis zonata CBS 506.65]
MPDQPRRIILEKSRTVRRRYQRSNKRFTFTASQLRRIEREEELENRAKKLREKENRRLENKKKRAEKDAKAREERKKLGLPDPEALRVPSSQPLLSKFLARPKAASPQVDESNEETVDLDSGSETEKEDYCSTEEEGEGEADKEAGPAAYFGLEPNDPAKDAEGDNSDLEFSQCSIFDNEILLVDEATVLGDLDTAKGTRPVKLPEYPARKPASALNSSFRDDTALLIEQMDDYEEFDVEEDFEQELLKISTQAT